MAWRKFFGRFNERKVIVGALIVAVLMAAFPPWRIPVPGEGISFAIGYHPILAPPNPIASVDLGRLLVQWAIVALLAGIALALRRKGPG